MTVGRQCVVYAAALAGLARWRWDRWPDAGDVPILDYVAAADPGFYLALQGWHYAGPAAAALIAGSAALSLWEVWGPQARLWGGRGGLPRWPRPGRGDPLLVVGEQHHPVQAIESDRPTWLTIPGPGLYTGIFVAGAVGSGKTAGCMRPFRRPDSFLAGGRSGEEGQWAGARG